MEIVQLLEACLKVKLKLNSWIKDKSKYWKNGSVETGGPGGGCSSSPPLIFVKFCFLWIEKNSAKVKNSTKNYKVSWNSSKSIDIYNIIIELDTKDGIFCQ